jgi:hypothetical protein
MPAGLARRPCDKLRAMLRVGIPPRHAIPALLLFSFFALAAPRPAGADIVGLRVTPVAFSPNADGIRDRALIQWNVVTNAAVDLRLTIAVSGGPGAAVARRFDLGPRPIGPDSLVWDGTDSLGVIAPDTLYALQLDELNSGGTVVANARVTVLLDVKAPPVPTIDNGDTTVTVSAFSLSGVAAVADTVVLFKDGIAVDTTAAQGGSGDFAFPIALAEGHNRFAAQSFDRAGNLSPQTIQVDVFYLNAPDVGIVKAVPGFFSPNGDGIADTTSAVFTLDAPTAELRVTVRRGTAPTSTGPDLTLPVAVVYDAPAAPGSFAVPWDGRDSTGTITSDGLYVFAVKAESLSAGGIPVPAALTRYAPFRLDNTPPLAPLLDPVPPAHTTHSVLTLTVNLVETDSVRIFRNGVQVVNTPTGLVGGTGTLHISVQLTLGDNAITLEGRDFSGNRSPLGGPYDVLYEAPIGFHGPERFTEGDAFNVNLNTPARLVEIDLFTLRGEAVRRLTSTSSLTRYEMPWDLKDTVGAFVGDGPYLARLRVTYPDGTVTEAKAAVVVVK